MEQLPFTFKEMIEKKAIRRPSNERRTSISYRGGKASIASWVISHFPPHSTFVDVFAGGGAISLAKSPSEIDVYNDKGNVSRFFSILREYGEDIYECLYLSPWSRDFFKWAVDNRDKYMDILEGEWIKDVNYEDHYKYYSVRWAVCWYVTILQSYRHEEDDTSWLVSKGVNSAKVYATHVDDFPKIIDRLRNVIIENKDCLEVIELYDSKDTLFYCDPPYLPGTWKDGEGSYRESMSKDEHICLLNKLLQTSGQVVISGYPSDLYEERLSGWRRASKVRMGMMKNSNQSATEREEVLWIKEHNIGIWSTAE